MPSAKHAPPTQRRLRHGFKLGDSGLRRGFKLGDSGLQFKLEDAFESLKKAQKAFDDEVWDLFQGAKERKWSPDRRPENMKGTRAGPGEESELMWGGAKSLEMYTRMIEESENDQQSFSGASLGSAAVTMYGESGKLTSDEMEEELRQFRSYQAPILGSPSRHISSAVELAELVRAKYGKYHDVAILRNTGQTAFNIYGPHLSQSSFPYTESQYLQKLNIIVAMLDDFDQAWYVKEFLLSPIVPRNGLPSTPRYDTAVTLRLNLSPTWRDVDPQKIEEWFSLPGFKVTK
ncbi:hypothetical protein TrLO_g12762 [Triparma laevis f. longispina]|uniref:Uncharacterized protein n=1 Tax=Triparma laevis f. longispina TaxID=1714387 RepID=A0A9W7A6H4_9STRA|nr:hypothetical protein TrLO_g12762 [Triparma laevis f. longispina]